eukprot:CAMPEP_0196575974 /NCGR_PEP_ID=MMETSP1081-20130531/5351_1 /TAXON_ID=36882 /ORGANISM="Pyramimonas amylifera, Strain CCMP720" /LENGTH=496 /DNA_ID=CAMNT_0041894445 /DNA_START=162 /DNA_END=1652 /DNA_ORIENTATION=+
MINSCPSFIQETFDIYTIKASLCVAGLLGTLVMYGIFQERIMTHSYGEAGEKFETSLLLVFVNRVCTMAVSFLICLCQRPTSSSSPHASVASFHEPAPSPFKEATQPPPHHYLMVSLANILATTCQFEALKFVTFPVQTLVKSSKMIPVMIWGSFMMKKKYQMIDYSVAVVVMLGCTFFLVTGEVTTSKSASRSLYLGYSVYSVMGAVLLILHLVCDGFASTFQDKLFHEHSMSFASMSFHVTLYSALVALAGLLLRGELGPSLAFASRHPALIVDMAYLSASATSSQLLISYTIRTFGALLFATVQTTRQFVSILLSCLLFAHTLSIGQGCGTALVFSALFYRAMFKGRGQGSERSGKKESKNEEEETELSVLLESRRKEDEEIETLGTTPWNRRQVKSGFKMDLSVDDIEAKDSVISPGALSPCPGGEFVRCYDSIPPSQIEGRKPTHVVFTRWSWPFYTSRKKSYGDEAIRLDEVIEENESSLIKGNNAALGS